MSNWSNLLSCICLDSERWMKGYMTWLHIECRQILVQENRYNNHLIFIRLNVRLTECNINSLGSLHVNLAPFHMWSYLKSICIHLQHENVTKSRIHENLYPHTNYRFEIFQYKSLQLIVNLLEMEIWKYSSLSVDQKFIVIWHRHKQDCIQLVISPILVERIISALASINLKSEVGFLQCFM